MATWNEVFEKIEDAGKKAGKAVVDTSEKIKAGYVLYTAENELNLLYTLLGKEAEEKWEGAPAELIEKIDAVKEKIKALKAQGSIAGRFCPACGSKVGGANVFCHQCGHKMEETENPQD